MIMETDTHICPSLLRETGGESGYSSKALKQLFDGKNISCELPYKHFDDNVGIDIFNNNSKRISVSGVQIKYSLVADDGILRLTRKSSVKSDLPSGRSWMTVCM